MLTEILTGIDFRYASGVVKLDWADIVFAMELGFFVDDDAIEFATFKVANEYQPTADELEMAMLMKGENVHPFIDNIANRLDKSQMDTAKEKFLYIILRWLFENRDAFSDPLQIAEYVYEDLDYPPEIEFLVRYMPMRKVSVVTRSNNYIDIAYENWNVYLHEKEEKFQ